MLLTDPKHSNLGMPPLQKFYKKQKLKPKDFWAARKNFTNILSILLIKSLFQ